MNKQNKNVDLFVQNVHSLAHTKPFNSSKNTEVKEHRNYLDAEEVKSKFKQSTPGQYLVK